MICMAPWDYLGDPDINVSLRKVAYTYLRRRSLLLLVRNGTKCANLERYCDSVTDCMATVIILDSGKQVSTDHCNAHDLLMQ